MQVLISICIANDWCSRYFLSQYLGFFSDFIDQMLKKTKGMIGEINKATNTELDFVTGNCEGQIDHWRHTLQCPEKHAKPTALWQQSVH